MSLMVGDYVIVERHDEDPYRDKSGYVIAQDDPRIFHETEWPLCTPGGITSPGNVWVYLDEPVKTKHTWQFSVATLSVMRPWQPPTTPEDIEVFLNG